MSTETRPSVSIIIKALNEERHIAAAIESALDALGESDGEVILADGGSSDRTVEIARRYPILIVQLNRSEDRSCGSGAQLGFQYSRGRYLLLMDGDMRVHSGFLAAAIDTLSRNPGLAGVGGVLSEPSLVNEEYEHRRKRHSPDRHPGRVTRLEGSAFYRRTAIESVGYLTDRNLHGFEEFDLGARLHSAGWALAKIDRPIAYHEPHTGSAYRLLLRRVRSRFAWAPGELVRAAVGRRHFWFVMRNDSPWKVCLLVTGWWITVLTMLAIPGWLSASAAVGIFLLPFAGMSLRWRSVRLGIYSVAAWNVMGLCFWPGLLRPRRSPASWIESTVLRDRRHERDGTGHQGCQIPGRQSNMPARDAEEVKS
ncbi:MULTISPECIES: glycosyltransferase [unclassified Bradyrhizobium]|uniref:glycosyltransferase n=1 Tax=unclassified Bradyrhizobium TaxID=2631580 RepID=UPI001BAAF924|nr:MULTISPECIES: glycosyltransferase [unclassified Bradyrhizobium]MBR1229043.1 glycosyltransferase [Bradyrhizobium sp. AUGA SZCCT0176]MBR1299022.1 glycosyltransferase [Bradyrhizobium sp. AUGA SZCCT0042]